jgi:hypothetical protein
MFQGICSQTLQLNQNVISVTKTTGQFVEVVRKRGASDWDDSLRRSSNPVRFHVVDLLEGYRYELTDHESFRRLTFHLTDATLTVDVDTRADIPSVAEGVAKLAEKEELLRATTLTK